MTVMLIVGLAWGLVSTGAALVLGRAVRLADLRTATAPWTDEVEQFLRDYADAQRSSAGPDPRAA